MTSVEVLAARDMVASLPDDIAGASITARALERLAIRVELREKALAERSAAAEKAEAEAAELAAYGGIAGAEAGWNALRQHNPKVDRSTGARDIRVFADLPHKKKLECAAFAFGVLNPGAKLGSPVPEEPYQFKVGDKVRINSLRSNNAGPVGLIVGGIAEVKEEADGDGDIKVRGESSWDGHLCNQWIAVESLTLATEPRTWDRPEPIPEGVIVTDARGRRSTRKHGFMERMDGSDVGGMDGPFTEVIA